MLFDRTSAAYLAKLESLQVVMLIERAVAAVVGEGAVEAHYAAWPTQPTCSRTAATVTTSSVSTTTTPRAALQAAVTFIFQLVFTRVFAAAMPKSRCQCCGKTVGTQTSTEAQTKWVDYVGTFWYTAPKGERLLEAMPSLS